MFRPIVVAAAAAMMVSMAGCADAPKPPPANHAPAASGPAAGAPAANAPSKVAIPAGKGEGDLTIHGNNSAVCQSDCDRRFRRCGDMSTASSSMGSDRIQSLTTPRLFSQADDCRHQLDQCLSQCSKVK